jgi:hypothetical protein
MNFDDVARLSRDLSGIEVGTSFGTPALRVRHKFMCPMREDDETLVLTPIDEIQQRFLRFPTAREHSPPASSHGRLTS